MYDFATPMILLTFSLEKLEMIVKPHHKESALVAFNDMATLISVPNIRFQTLVASNSSREDEMGETIQNNNPSIPPTSRLGFTQERP